MRDYIMIDCHVHSGISPDSEETYKNICEVANKREIKYLTVTEHYECSDSRQSSQYFTDKYIQKYYNTFMDEKKKWVGEIELGFGIELGQPHLNMKYADKIVKENPFDYVLASCHKIDNIDLSQYDYNQIDLEKMTERYLKELLELVQCNCYDCLGHMDLPKRYAYRQGKKICLSAYDERVEEILKKIISSGHGIEINTSGLRQGVQSCFPSLELLKRYVELGGEIVTVGSDAHRAYNVGDDIEIAYEYIRAAGLHYVCVYLNRRPKRIKI